MINALRHLNNEQMKALADSLNARLPSELLTDELRKELKQFNSWMCGKQYDGQIPLIDTCIDDIFG